MSLSNNIKRMRLEKGLTQEQLAARLGVSAQAVSKWETSDTYPDGALLVPLAKMLEASLDDLLENDTVSMVDLSNRITTLICKTPKEERFQLSCEIAWQINRALFACSGHEEPAPYNPEDFKTQVFSSTVLGNMGFTLVSNGKEPFFSIFPAPPAGFGEFLNEREWIEQVFAALAREHTVNALLYLYRRDWKYVFEKSVLAEQCKIPDDQIDRTLEDLMLLRIVIRQKLNVNGEPCVIFYSKPRQEIVALWLIAKELGYTGPYCQTSYKRGLPLLKG